MGWGEVSQENWKKFVFERIQQLNWPVVLADVRPFVEPGFDLDILTRENLEKSCLKPEQTKQYHLLSRNFNLPLQKLKISL